MLDAPPPITDDAVVAPRPDWTAMGTSEHFVQFYDADAALVDAVAGYIGSALRAGDVGIVVASPAHREAIEQRLLSGGLDLLGLRERGRYVALDASEMLYAFMVDGSPNPTRFAEVFEGIIAQALLSDRRVRIFGEMVALLALEGNHSAAVLLEELWNDLQTRHSFGLFCAYPTTSLSGPALAETLGNVCAQHARVIPAESYTDLPTPDERLRAIVQWQQKAASLEAALAAERAARRAAEEALRVRDEFLSIASHELRTPLTALSGHAQMVLRQLQRDSLPAPDRLLGSVTTIREQAGKLTRLINQLLDVTRLETGMLVIEPAPTDLTALIEQVVWAVRVVGTEHTITISAPRSLEARVDPLRLEQVLTNLLGNAVRYSPTGAPIDVMLALDGPSTVELSVRDRGPGIPAEKRERLFERFSHPHPNVHQRGMGLGLYISHQIVELHGGTIHAEFPPDGGSCFVVRLPL